MSTFDIDSEIRLVVSGEKGLSQLSRALHNAGEDLDVIELALSEATQEMLKSQTAAVGYAQTVRKLGQELNKLSKQSGRAAIAGLSTTQRGDIRAASTDDRADTRKREAAQSSYESYVKASNARIAASEAKSLKSNTAIASAQYTARKAAVARDLATKRAAIAADAAAVKSAENAKQREYRETQAAINRQTDELINLRYAQYDVASAYTSIGIAASAVVAGTVGVGAMMEQQFASVARTTGAVGQDLSELRSNLINLSTEMPVAFGDITNIATIGAQLNVANDDLDTFTGTVARFSASTNVSVEETATAIGRIAQLTGTAGADFERLASSIYATGVTAVATEGEILAVTSEIATAGDLAGFTNHQIVALASSLASLGVQPEGARGSIMRIFGMFDKAIADGGAKLDQFAEVSGMTAAEFADAWSNSPQEALQAFVQGLGEVDKAGGSMKGTLRELGVVNVRDEKLVSLLANNYDVWATAIDETAAAYAEGTALQEGYATQTDTLISQLTILKNNFVALAGEGMGPVLAGLKLLTEQFIEVVEATRGFVNNPVGKVIAGIVVAFSAAAAIAAVYMTAIALLRGNIAAFATAQQKLSGTALATNTSLTSLVLTYAKVAMGNKAALNGVLGLNKGLEAQSAAAGKAAASTRVAGAAAKTASVAMGALKFAGPMVAFTAAIELGTLAWKEFERAQMSALEKSRADYGEIGGLSDAISADTQAFEETGEAIRTVTQSFSEGTQTLEPWAQSLATATGAHVELSDKTATTETNVKKVTLAIGEQTQALLNQAATTRALEFWDQYGHLLKDTSFDLNEFALELANGGDATAVLQRAIGELEVSQTRNSNAITAGSAAQREWANSTDGTRKTQLELAKAVDTAAEMQTGLTAELEEGQKQASVYGALSAESAKRAAQAKDKEKDATEDVIDANNTLADALAKASAPLSGLLDVADAMSSLGASLANNGLDFSAETEAGRANLQSLSSAISAMASQAGDDNVALATNISGMMSNLQAQGVVFGDEMDWVLQYLNTLVGNSWGVDFSTEAARTNVRQYIADLISMIDIQNAAAEAAWAGAQAARKSFEYSNMFRTDGAKVDTSAIPLIQSAPKLQDTSGLKGILDSMNASKGDVKRNTDAMAQGFDSVGRSAGGAADKVGGVGDKAKEAAKEVRTLSDYASDLQGVLSRAFELHFGVAQAKRQVNDAIRDIREDIEKADWPSIDELLSSASHRKAFSRGSAKDAVTQMFRDLKDAAQEAKQAVRDAAIEVQDAKAKIAGLKSDEGTLMYWRGIALEYGNMERVAEIDAELAQNRADQAAANRDLADSEKALADSREAATNKSLTGNSDQALTNRADVRDLVGGHLDYIQALKDSGASQTTVDKAVQAAYKDFMAQGKALGYNTEELKVYGAAIKDSGKVTAGAAMSQSEIAQALEDVTEEYMNTAVAMAEAGYTQDQINAYLAQGKQRVKDLAAEMGASPEVTKKATAAFGSFMDIVKTIPKNVTVKINTLTPSEAAVKEFLAKYDNNTVNIKAQGTGSVKSPTGGWPAVSVPVNGLKSISVDKVTTTDKVISVTKALASVIAAKRGANGKTGTIAVSQATATAVNTIAKSMGIPKATAAELLADLLTVASTVKVPTLRVTGTAYLPKGVQQQNRWGGVADGSISAFAKGGAVTRASQQGRDTVQALLDPKEFVMNREAHSYYGTDLMNAINQRRLPKSINVPTPIIVQGGAGSDLQAVELVHSSVVALGRAIGAAVANGQQGLSIADIANAMPQISSLNVSTGRG